MFRCRLLLENPNTEDLKVRGGRATLALAGLDAGSAKPLESFVLPGLGSREVDFQVTLDLLSSLSGVLRLLKSGNGALDYTLQGYVDLDVQLLGRRPFTITGKVQVNELLSILPGRLGLDFLPRDDE